LVEYKTEAFKMFMELMDMIADETLGMVFKLFPERPEQMTVQRGRRPVRREDMVLTHDSAIGSGFGENREPVPAATGLHHAPGAARPPQKLQPIRVGEKVGRNDPCPCGSGKKYKNCHGS
jgi:preprotein translocase subunit SecA